MKHRSAAPMTSVAPSVPSSPPVRDIGAPLAKRATIPAPGLITGASGGVAPSCIRTQRDLRSIPSRSPTARLPASVRADSPSRRSATSPIGDNAYINNSVVRNRPKNVHVMGRGRMDAALYAPAPKGAKGRGRRVKGKRLASPKDRRGTWATLKLLIYGRPATVQVKLFKAVWYKCQHRRK